MINTQAVLRAVAGIVVVTLFSIGCGGSPPTAPTLPQTQSGFGQLTGEARASSHAVAGGWTGVVLDPGEQFVTPGGTAHGRDLVLAVTFTGDVSGTGLVTEDFNVNANSTGMAGGYIELDATWNGRSGAFSGALGGGRFFEGFFDGNWVLHGSGDLEGLVFRFRTRGPAFGPFTYEGTIVDPNGG